MWVWSKHRYLNIYSNEDPNQGKLKQSIRRGVDIIQLTLIPNVSIELLELCRGYIVFLMPGSNHQLIQYLMSR